MMRTELGAALGSSRTETPTNWIAEEGSAGWASTAHSAQSWDVLAQLELGMGWVMAPAGATARGAALCKPSSAGLWSAAALRDTQHSKCFKLRWGNGKTLVSVEQESISERGLSEIINAHQIQIWIRSTLRTEIWSWDFLHQRNHLLSDHDWPGDKEVWSERHVCQEPLFSLFLPRLAALPDGWAASRRAF